MAACAGIINVNKEKGFTSFDIVAILRRLFKQKAGHTGTLDPNAAGVLPVCLGKATKFSEYFMSQNKSYTAEVLLGVRTTTDDVTGEILYRTPAPTAQNHSAEQLVREESMRKKINLTQHDITKTVETFKGKQMQMPPMYSAIKINGKKLYEIARTGQTVERKARHIEIYDINITSFAKNSFTINVDCSKGTYIRSLCSDIGEKLGCGAVMGDLVRTRSGQFEICGALTISKIKDANDPWLYVKKIEELLPYPFAILKTNAYNSAKNGNPVKLSCLSDYDPNSSKHWLKSNEETIGLFSLHKNNLICEVML